MIQMFHEVEFPRNISYGSSFGPTFSTDVVTLPNGAEQRNVNWEYPRCKGNLTSGLKTEGNFKQFLDFFVARQGRAYGFRYYDWFDHHGQFEWLGDSGTQFQLRKWYVSGNVGLIRKIVKPITGSISVVKLDISSLSIDGLTDGEKALIFQTECEAGHGTSVAFTVDVTTGVITLSNAIPSNNVCCASFDFDVPVRFDTDEMSANYELFKAYGWNDIPVVELKF